MSRTSPEQGGSLTGLKGEKIEGEYGLRFLTLKKNMNYDERRGIVKKAEQVRFF